MADIGIKISATDAASGVFKTVAGEASRLQTSVGYVSAALASMGVSLSAGAFVAFITNINNGVDALNDLKDATGASIENISALEDVARRTGSSFDTVSTALVKLNQGLSAAKPGSDTERAIKAIGLSVSELKTLDPAEAFRRIAVSLSGFEDDANKARLTQELFGKSLKEVAPLLKDLAEQGQLNATVTTAQAEAAEKLNKQIFNLQKNALDAGRAITGTLVPALSEGVDRFLLAQKHAGGLLDTLAMYNRLDYSQGIQGNLSQVEQQIATLEQRAGRITSESARKGNDKQLADLRSQAAYLKELRQLKILDDQGDVGDAVSRKYQRKTSVGDVTGGDTGKAAAKALADQNRELAAQAQLLASLSGVNGDYQEQLTRLQVVRKSQNMSDARYSELVTELIDKQPMVKALYADQEKVAKAWADQSAASAKAVAELNRDYDAYVKTLDNSAAAAAKQVQALQDEEAATLIAAQQNISLAQAIEQVTIARLAEAQAKAYANGDQEAGDAIQREINARKELATLIAGKEVRDANKKAAEDASKEWGKAADKLQDSITDALMRGFENGHGFAENFRDTVQNMFKTMVLRPVVQATVSGGLQLAGMGGGLGNTLGAGSALGNTGALSGLAALGSAFGGSFASGFQLSMGGGAGMAFEGGAAMLGGASGGTSALAGLGQMAGAAAPYVIAAVIAKEIASGLNGGSEYTTGTGISGKFSGNQFSGSNYQDWRNEGDKLFGMSVGHSSSGTNYSALDSGLSKSMGKAYANILTQTADYAKALGDSAGSITGYQKDIRLSLGSDVEANKKAIADMFKGMANEVAATVLDAQYIREGEGAADTLARLATNLTVVNGALDTLGDNLLTVGQYSGDAASALVDSFGGQGQYQSAIGAYYQRFYSAEERMAKTREQLQTKFAASGLGVPDGLDAYRDLVNAQDLATESGRNTYAMLIGLSSAFADVSQSAEDAAKQLIKAARYSTYSDYAGAAAAAGIAAAPRFASGGDHLGGVRLVGENGPEIEVTGASRIWNKSQMAGAMMAGSTELAARMDALREDSRAQARAMATLQARMVKLLEAWDAKGMPEVRTV